jgi:hypothetical protein
MIDKFHKPAGHLNTFQPMERTIETDDWLGLQFDSVAAVNRLVGATDHTDLEDFAVHTDTE